MCRYGILTIRRYTVRNGDIFRGPVLVIICREHGNCAESEYPKNNRDQYHGATLHFVYDRANEAAATLGCHLWTFGSTTITLVDVAGKPSLEAVSITGPWVL